jgi:TonB family protein
MIATELSRLRTALFIAIPMDVVLWLGASSAFLRAPMPDLAPVEITRVVVDDKGHKVEKVIKKEDVQKKVTKAVEHLRTPKPIPHPTPTQKPPPPQQPKPQAPPPEGAHNKVLTAPATDKQPSPSDQTALAGGNADVGKPSESQNQGGAKVNPPTPPTPQPQPQPQPAPVAVPPAKPTPAPAPEPKPTPEPPKPEPPKPKGPSKDAEASSQVQPEIPESLKTEQLKTYVRVRVTVEEDGSFSVTLRTSSGNEEVDRRVLSALQRWKWKPALKDGEPVRSTQLFKFEFEIQ